MKYLPLIFLGVFVGLPVFAQVPDSRPNIVVILCDDLGYGDLRCYDHPVIQTPTLDRLAAEGIRFTDFYATASVCSASRAGLLTGRTPTRIGVYDWIPAKHEMHLRQSEITYATVLKQSGYDTAHVGKWHCNGKFNSPEQPQPNDHGFDHWMSTQNNANPTHENPTNFVRNGQPLGPMEGYSCQIVVNEAIDWLTKRPDQNKPFCLFVCFHETHEKVASPKELIEKYKALGVSKPGQAEYYANVENVDLAVGRLVEQLKKEGHWENTLTFFTSDNGPEELSRYPEGWRSHGTTGGLRGMKLWLYEGGVRVPGIAVWPNTIQPGQVSHVPVGAIDFFPTFCTLAQAEMPTDRCYDGTDLVPLFQGKELKRSKPLFWYYINAFGEPRVAMRDGDWKLVATLKENSLPAEGQSGHDLEWFATIKTSQLDRFELYNLVSDRREQADLSNQEPERFATLKCQMEMMVREIQQEAPLW